MADSCMPAIVGLGVLLLGLAGGRPRHPAPVVLVERAMTFAVEEYDDDLAVARQACDGCLSYTDIDLGIRGRAIGLLARVLYPDLPPDAVASHN